MATKWCLFKHTDEENVDLHSSAHEVWFYQMLNVFKFSRVTSLPRDRIAFSVMKVAGSTPRLWGPFYVELCERSGCA